ncbi:MAG: DUF4332 domain-containing protein [Actinomycetia bacterium]|nr:DUF4332 domain-containing protein [Actinomycetes bacterium]
MEREPDDQPIGLDDLRARIEETDLIPSQEPLLEDITTRFAQLVTSGVGSVSELRSRLRNPKSLAALAETSGVEPDYLVLLKRVLGGFVPKPRPIKDFDWLDSMIASRLKDAGITNTHQFIEAARRGIEELEQDLDLDHGTLAGIAALCDLCRVQWVSPKFAGALLAAGYPSAEAVAAADPDELHAATARANELSGFYKGTVGRRDVGRLVHTAGYVHWK